MSEKQIKKKSKTMMGAAHSSILTSDKTNENSSKYSSGVLPVNGNIPLEIVEEIFHKLSYNDVIRHCSLVCKQWKEAADSESLWRDRCRREGFLPCDVTKTPKDWRLYYILCKKRRNLLKNPRAEHEFKDWKIECNGGDQWIIEDPKVPHPNENVQRNFVTSYGMCLKSQQVDLKLEGYSPIFMDKFQPPIKITDWYAARWDCACEYTISVDLLNSKKKCVQRFEPKTIYIEQWNDQQWHKMTHVFKNYGADVRYIRFKHGGKDSQFWAGWYGIRVTDSCVEICPNIG